MGLSVSGHGSQNVSYTCVVILLQKTASLIDNFYQFYWRLYLVFPTWKRTNLIIYYPDFISLFVIALNLTVHLPSGSMSCFWGASWRHHFQIFVTHAVLHHSAWTLRSPSFFLSSTAFPPQGLQLTGCCATYRFTCQSRGKQPYLR